MSKCNIRKKVEVKNFSVYAFQSFPDLDINFLHPTNDQKLKKKSEFNTPRNEIFSFHLITVNLDL